MTKKNILFFLLLIISWASFSQGKKEIFLEDIFSKNTFKQDYVAGFRSMNDGNFYTEIKDKKLIKMNFENGEEVATLLNFSDLNFNRKEIVVSDYIFNKSETKLLLFTEIEHVYRRSMLSKVYIYDFNTKKIIPLSSQKVMHASFSPDGEKVAYVFENNLYYYDITHKETVQVTDDGNYNIINGNCDWVYEEEFEFTRAYEWSAQSDYIAYYRFDQSDVPEYSFSVYDNLYPTSYKYKYPKAGEKNSIININIYRIDDDRTVRCETGDIDDIYIPRIKINPFDNSLIIYRLNRLQNELEFLSVNPKNGKSKLIYDEKNKYYVEINDQITFLSKRNSFVYTSEKDGFKHIYLHDIDQNLSTQLTKGNWEVTDIKGVDEAKNIIYYMSTEKSPLERHLYKISTNGNDKKCLTPEEGWHDINFNSDYTYFLEKYSKINQVPVYYLVNEKLDKKVLKDNAALKTKMAEYKLSNFELFKVPGKDGTELNGWLLKPYDFSEDHQYPLLMYQYSGPGSQQVTNQFAHQDMWWYQMLAQNGYVIVCVDGTGTGYRGEEFKKKTYLNLGKLESDDQIAVAKYFAQHPNIDPKRIGIWGWSYGGFMSSICIMKGADIFKTAVAVAPVTNWRYYDNIYTERYMRTPKENAKGYDDNSPINMVDKLEGNFLLIHGSSDDNVHLQNSMMMIQSMINKNKDFDSEIYPNKNHGISGGITRLQLYRRITNYLMENL
ncbi:MAG TPA: S9 family peptidase [Chitinophagaceae bacterium]|nr:MAG: dipeptidyl-peptidase IV [Bacteroidetes bacterium OLB11]HMN33530.1 S9 family peptidase [Chitinophagaceae bacterium]